jgi:hypothetical protein
LYTVLWPFGYLASGHSIDILSVIWNNVYDYKIWKGVGRIDNCSGVN